MVCRARILIVDRDPAVPLRLHDKLKQRGYLGVEAASYDEALRLADAGGADIIVVNPANDRGSDADPLVVVLKTQPTTADIPVLVIGGPPARADALLPKAFDDAELFARLDALSRLATMHDELRRRAATTRKYGFDAPQPPAMPEHPDDARILLAATSPEATEAMAAAIGPDGTLTISDDGTDVLARLAGENFDALVVAAESDWHWAADICRDVRGNPRLFHLPILALAGTAQVAGAGALIDRGANDVLMRPWQAATVGPRLMTLVRQHRFRARLQGLYREARHFATSDALTGLYTYGFLLDHLTSQVDDARRFGRELTVAMLGVADMAALNREFGYVAGDRLLRQIGSLIGSLVRGEDLTARYRGADFCVVLPGTGLEAALNVVRRLAAVIERTDFALPGVKEAVQVRMKVGAAALGPVDTAEGLLARVTATMA